MNGLKKDVVHIYNRIRGLLEKGMVNHFSSLALRTL